MFETRYITCSAWLSYEPIEITRACSWCAWSRSRDVSSSFFPELDPCLQSNSHSRLCRWVSCNERTSRLERGWEDSDVVSRASHTRNSLEILQWKPVLERYEWISCNSKITQAYTVLNILSKILLARLSRALNLILNESLSKPPNISALEWSSARELSNKEHVIFLSSSPSIW